MKYTINEFDDIEIKHRGCTIQMPDAPHPSLQKWNLKYCGIEVMGMAKDTPLRNIPDILFSEKVNESELKNYLDEFIDNKINKFPYK
jgi:hypothetical protein